MPTTKHPQHAQSTKTECDYLNGWIKNDHIRKNLTQNGEPKRYSWGTSEKKNNNPSLRTFPHTTTFTTTTAAAAAAAVTAAATATTTTTTTTTSPCVPSPPPRPVKMYEHAHV